MNEAMTTALTTAFTAVKTDAMSVIGTALPIALALVGTVMAINIGIRFFKKITAKA